VIKGAAQRLLAHHIQQKLNRHIRRDLIRHDPRQRVKHRVQRIEIGVNRAQGDVQRRFRREEGSQHPQARAGHGPRR